jgi:hypothetical protein
MQILCDEIEKTKAKFLLKLMNQKRQIDQILLMTSHNTAETLKK